MSASTGRVAGDVTARRIESRVASLLVAGTWLAVALILVGVAGMLVTGVSPLDTVAAPLEVAQIPADLLALRPEGFLWAGLLVVLVLPIGRVVVSGLGFLAAGDRLLAAVSLAVLLVVLVSVVAAIGLGG